MCAARELEKWSSGEVQQVQRGQGVQHCGVRGDLLLGGSADQCAAADPDTDLPLLTPPPYKLILIYFLENKLVFGKCFAFKMNTIIYKYTYKAARSLPMLFMHVVSPLLPASFILCSCTDMEKVKDDTTYSIPKIDLEYLKCVGLRLHVAQVEERGNSRQCGGRQRGSSGQQSAGARSSNRNPRHLPSFAHISFKLTSKVVCGACGGKCSGEVLRVTDKYFHTACFTCRACSASLARGGFFCKDGHYYCPQDYQRAFGTRCAACSQYVEGEVVSALGNTYHQKCFTCARCKRAFPSGEKVTYTGSEVICGGCAAPQRHTARATASPASPTTPASPGSPGSPASPASPRSPGSPISPDRDDVDQRQPDPNDCAGCGQELSEGQALVALDRQWHTWCFACGECGAVLRGEYMGRGGVPYCERDYQRLFGVRCAYCQRYISGKVLQAGDNHHFHPTCARCSKCGDPFGDGEEIVALQEPIELSHYPSAYKPPPGTKPKIERDDFPAPPYPYTDPERRRRWSDTYKGVPDSDEEEGRHNGHNGVDHKLRREERELAKIESGIAQVFLKEVKEREKLQQWKKQNLDPRNASRTPSAAREAAPRLRYSSPVGASPSRSLDHRDLRDRRDTRDRASADHAHLPTYNGTSSHPTHPHTDTDTAHTPPTHSSH
ncbi:Actin-binding LIM protein 1 [Papilio xuthus]|uniref:Actin-binding LIM protein 1 n=1 Tax=Papilio xuthus TaxID=66420 RepID=A0A0N1PF58_PAPXU|nr:Actin-binding LIM protein 1 [Papilio xuthus]